MEKPSSPSRCGRAVRPTGEGTTSPGIRTCGRGSGLRTPSQRPKAAQIPSNPFFFRKTHPGCRPGADLDLEPLGVTPPPNIQPRFSIRNSPAIHFPPPGEKILRFVFSRGVMIPAGAFPARGLKIAPGVWLPPVPAPLPGPLINFWAKTSQSREGRLQGSGGTSRKPFPLHFGARLEVESSWRMNLWPQLWQQHLPWGAAQLSPHQEGQECALKVFSSLCIPPAGAASSVTHRMLLPSASVTCGPSGPMDLITFGEQNGRGDPNPSATNIFGLVLALSRAFI